MQYASAAGDAAPRLLHAAERLRRLAPELSRETYLEAIEAAARAGPLSNPDIYEVARRAASEAPPAGATPRGVDLLLDAYATIFTRGPAAAAPIFEAALAAFCNETAVRKDTSVQLGAVRAAASLWDEHAWETLATRLVRRARDAGELTVLPAALDMVAGLEIFRGHFDSAARLIQEEDTITTATGGVPLQHARLMLAGCRGDEEQTTASADAMLHQTTAGGQGYDMLAANQATAILWNGMGRYDLALKAALDSFRVMEEPFADRSASEDIEAAVRSGDPDAAAPAIRQLSAGTSRTDWALGIRARGRALITNDGPLCEQHHTEAITRLERTTAAFDLARAHLLYGEWLRRARRRSDASAQLRTAYEMFASMPAEAFATRAAHELRAVGGQRLTQVAGKAPQLTPQQTQIAFLASEGRSNQEIAAQLFISPRTVEYHLHNIFDRLGITSRGQLAQALDTKHS